MFLVFGGKEMKKKYWHELSDEEYQREVVDGNLTVKETMKKYEQPDWCNYSDALEGVFGCWSLMGKRRKKISRDSCKTCDYYIKE